MIEINLLPPDIRKKSKSKINTTMLPVVVGVAVLSIGIGVTVAQMIQISQYTSQTKRIEQEAAAYSQFTKDLAKWESEKKQFDESKRWIKGLDNEKSQVSYFLLVLTKVVPHNAWLTKVSLEGNEVSIEGKGLSYDALVTFMDNLKVQKCFAGNPLLINSESAPLQDGSQTNIVSFVIKGNLLGGHKE